MSTTATAIPATAKGKPTVGDRLAAATMIARLNSVADKPDWIIRDTIALCLMEYREAYAIGPQTTIEQLRLGLELAHGVMMKAGALMSFLRANAGDTADWPVRLAVDDTETARHFARLLTELETSLGKLCRYDQE